MPPPIPASPAPLHRRPSSLRVSDLDDGQHRLAAGRAEGHLVALIGFKSAMAMVRPASSTAEHAKEANYVAFPSFIVQKLGP